MIAGWSSIAIGEYGFVADFVSELKSFSAKNFDACYNRAKRGVFEGVPISVIHLNDLISEKRSSARSKDLDDVENLERIRNQSGG